MDINHGSLCWLSLFSFFHAHTHTRRQTHQCNASSFSPPVLWAHLHLSTQHTKWMACGLCVSLYAARCVSIPSVSVSASVCLPLITFKHNLNCMSFSAYVSEDAFTLLTVFVFKHQCEPAWRRVGVSVRVCACVLESQFPWWVTVHGPPGSTELCVNSMSKLLPYIIRVAQALTNPQKILNFSWKTLAVGNIDMCKLCVSKFSIQSENLIRS